MKYLLLISLFLFFACNTSKDIVSVPNPPATTEPIVLNLEYEGESLPAMQLDKLIEAELKILDPSGKLYPQNLLYTPIPGERGSLIKILPYNGEEIPAMHIDNSTLRNIRNKKGTILLPQVIE